MSTSVWAGLWMVVGVVALGLLYWTHKRVAVRTKHAQPAAAAVVQRRWVRPKNKVRFLSTHHPVRLAYQSWLKELLVRGVTLRTTETPRQLAARAKAEGHAASGAVDLEVLTRTYEAARYGSTESDGYDSG